MDSTQINRHPVSAVSNNGSHLVCSKCGERVRTISKSNTTLLHASEWKRW